MGNLRTRACATPLRAGDRPRAVSPTLPPDAFPLPPTLRNKPPKNEKEAHKLEAPRPPMAVTNAVSWRSEGIKHRKNEIFLDVVEKLNLLVSANGTVLRSEILGSLQMRSYLSGMPVRAPFSLS